MKTDFSITVRQQEVLDTIERLTDEWNGRRPTLREVMKPLGIKSTNGLKEILDILERKNLVRWEFNKFRTLHVLRPKNRGMPLLTLEALDQLTDAEA